VTTATGAAAPPRARIATGLNHNLRHNGRLYHVQTETCTIRGALHVQSVVFLDGAVLYKTQEPCPEDLAEQRRHLVHSHKKAMVTILSKPRESASATTTLPSAELTPNPLVIENTTAGNAPATVDKARGVLVDLTTTPGFRAMGLFTCKGRALSFVSTHDHDIQSLGQSMADTLASLRRCIGDNALGALDTAEIRTSSGTLIVVSFENSLREYGGDVLATLSHVLVLVAPETSAKEIEAKIRTFMEHILAGLRDFPRAVPV
jgi:hypothetical protein